MNIIFLISPDRGRKNQIFLLISFFLLLLVVPPPAFALGFTYLDTNSQPTLVAHSEGNVQFYPDTTFNVTFVLTNKGRETAMQVAPRLSPGAYNPSTALGVTVTPDAGDAPITIKTLPIVAGDIGSWDKIPVTISGTIHQDAPPGIYSLPIKVVYNYVYAIPMTGDAYSSVNKLYKEKEQILPIRIRIMGDIRPSISNEEYINLVPGTQGYLKAVIKNIGYETGTEVIFSITPSDNSIFQIVDGGEYFGRFASGQEAPIEIRLAVKDGIAAGSYPAVLEGQYKDSESVIHSIKPVSIGITISRGAKIEAVTNNLTISPGETTTIDVTYRNVGDKPATDAQARIIGNQIIIPQVDTASLGTLAPGDRVTAQYTISANAPISGKVYDVDTEVKYRDELGALMLSDMTSFGIAIIEPVGLVSILLNPVYLLLIIGIIVLLMYAGWKYKKRNEN